MLLEASLRPTFPSSNIHPHIEADILLTLSPILSLTWMYVLFFPFLLQYNEFLCRAISLEECADSC